MHRYRTILTAALVVMVSLTAMAPAAAGGPTSALLSVPGEGKTASLYYTDPEYDALAGLVGIEGNAGVGTVDESGQGHANGPGVTVTWLIHDVAPWRIDHIYLEGEGAPWIATQLLLAENRDGAVVWHQPESGRQLAALLDKLGVGGPSRDADDFTGVAGAPVSPPAEPTAETATPAEPSTTDGVAGIYWGIAGLVIGGLSVGLWMRLRGNRTAEAGARDNGDPALLVP